MINALALACGKIAALRGGAGSPVYDMQLYRLKKKGMVLTSPSVRRHMYALRFKTYLTNTSD